MNLSEMDYIYNALCPVCGSKPSYTITGFNSDGRITTFNENTCGHIEIETLIEENRRSVFEKYQEKTKTVRFSLRPKTDQKNDDDEDPYIIPKR